MTQDVSGLGNMNSSSKQPVTIGKLVLQGVAGSIPFQALVFFTLYFQLLGFSNFVASALMSGFLFATAFGGMLGGWIGDKSAPLLCCLVTV